MRGIADSGLLVAFLSERDQYSDWAYRFVTSELGFFITCEAVLVETAYILDDAAAVLALLKRGVVEVAFSLEENQEEVAWLAGKYADRQPDLADLCLIRMSELYPDLPVITIDNDFRVYRRNRREMIPLIMPPGR